MFNNQISGKNEYYWFLAQVVDRVNWEKNNNTKIHFRDDVPGWGYRYKIAIYGRHPQAKIVPDDQLEMADVVLPVTAGSGHGGSAQTTNIRQGTLVTGFYKDGQDATEPIITGIIPNNSQTRLFGGDPDLNFIPRSGYLGKEGGRPVSSKNILTEEGDIKFPPFLETAEQVAAIYHYDQLKDGARCHHIPKTRTCDGPNGEMKGIQRQLKNVINFVNEVKSKSDTFVGKASDLANAIPSLLDDATVFITNLLKTLIDKIRGYVVNKFNDGIKDAINLVPPNLAPTINEANEKGTDAIQCGFNAIISKLIGVVQSLLNDIIDKYINAPMCAVENFIGGVLGSILGDISSTIQGALEQVNGLIGSVSKFLGDAFSVVDTIFGVLKFITCEEQVDCSMVEDWSFWYGAKCVTDEIPEDSKEKIKRAAEAQIDQRTPKLNPPPCDTNQLPCGPPNFIVDPLGVGIGSGALGNPIISGSGSLLAIDLISGGSDYQNPHAKVVDTCGNGNGAILLPRLENASIKDVVVLEPGVGFLPAPNGSTGANQSTYSQPDESIYEDTEGNKQVVKCKKTISVFVGDKLYLPQATTTEVYDKSGNALQILNGLGQITPISIAATGRVTIPCEVSNPIRSAPFPSSNGSYPVAIGISNVFVTNPGIGYTSGDTITVTPDNGAVLEPIITDGQLTGVNVIQSGIGFTEFPQIIVNTNTGFNAGMVPVFKIIRVNETPDEVPLGTPLIEVIDCVGRVL